MIVLNITEHIGVKEDVSHFQTGKQTSCPGERKNVGR